MSNDNTSIKTTDLTLNKSNLSGEYDKTKLAVSNSGDVTAHIKSKTSDHRKNLPGLQQHVSPTEASVDSPERKRPKLTSSPVAHSPEPCSSPEVGKRRRIQHDYRRLSSAGYLDDYETRRERRFSSESDPSQSPSPTKSKSSNTTPTKLITPEFPSVPRVKLKLKLLKNDGESIQSPVEKGN